MKLYLAGPDVFRPDALQWAKDVRALCRREGHEALIPLDGRKTEAVGIYRNNLRLIGEADAVLANLNPFRGSEPDSGTCVEIGYADDLRPMRERLDANADCRDIGGWAVEDFGLALNLMLAVPVQLEPGGIDAALRALARPTSRAAPA